MSRKFTIKQVAIFVLFSGAVLLAVALWVINSHSTTNAVNLARTARTLSSKRTNEEEIRHGLSIARGTIEVNEWECAMVGPGIYLAVLRINHNGARKGYAFEVNVRLQVVRNVFESSALIERYGFTAPQRNPGKPNELIKIVRAQFPGEKRSDDALLLELGQVAEASRPEWFEQFPDFFRETVALHDDLDTTGYRLKMPTPSEFIEELRLGK